MECERLIKALQEKTPAEAHDTLQQIQVFRQGGQLQACIDTARTSQVRSSSKANLQVGQLAGMYVFNERGEQIGTVDRLARGSDQRIHVLMTYRGPRWPGSKQVAVPLNNMAMHAGRLLLPGIGEKDLLAMPAVPQDGGAYKPLDKSEGAGVPHLDASSEGAGVIRRRP